MIRVGPAGWSYADWEGIVYPAQKPRGFHPLRMLSRYVDCIEVNSSFYATPRADYAQRWVELVAEVPDFRFTAKLQNVFTHQGLGDDYDELARAYLAGIEPLRSAGRLSALLVQFPLGFRRSDEAEARLARLGETFGQVPLVLEVRHRSWFTDDGPAAIQRLGYSLARIDLPPAADHPPDDAPWSGPIGYLRLHGRNAESWFTRGAGRDQRYDYLYDEAEVGEIVRLTRRLASATDETFVITNNHFSGKAVANALEILAGVSGKPPLAPAHLIGAYPRLADKVRPDGQTTLF